MAFPTLNAQQGKQWIHYVIVMFVNCECIVTQPSTPFLFRPIVFWFHFSFFVSELNNRKILEDLQIKKQLILQKGVSAVGSTPVNNANHLNASMPLVAYDSYLVLNTSAFDRKK